MSAQMEAYVKAIDYKITDGSEFLWQCFGPDARFLDSSDDIFHISAVFDTKTQRVYEVSISETYGGDLRYRWIDMEYLDAYKSEAKQRNVKWDEFTEELNWHMTDDFDDIIDKVTKIPKGEEYDPRVVLVLELEDDVKEMIETAAALRGVSIDQFVEEALKAVIAKEEK